VGQFSNVTSSGKKREMRRHDRVTDESMSQIKVEEKTKKQTNIRREMSEWIGIKKSVNRLIPSQEGRVSRSKLNVCIHSIEWETKEFCQIERTLRELTSSWDEKGNGVVIQEDSEKNEKDVKKVKNERIKSSFEMQSFNSIIFRGIHETKAERELVMGWEERKKTCS